MYRFLKNIATYCVYIIVSMLVSTEIHAAEIGTLKIDDRIFSLSFVGEGKAPPLNRLIELELTELSNSELELRNVLAGGAGKQMHSPSFDFGIHSTSNETGARLYGPRSNVVLEAFDAQMPEHDHGMFVTPKIIRLKTGKYMIRGVKLHMAGRWELAFKWSVNGKVLEQSIFLNI